MNSEPSQISVSAEKPNSVPDCDYEVIVVGYGPAGAVAALWLGQAGIRTLVIDKSKTIWQIPRAIAIDHEILRVFQNLGVAEEVLPCTAPFPASEHFGVDGQLIRRIHVVEPPYPLGYTPTMVFTQPAVEAILRKHVAGLQSVTVELGSQLTGIAQNDSAATVQLTTGHVTRQLKARYVIGCDGASSSVRRLLGITFNDLGFDEPWLVIDVKVNEWALSKLPQTAAQYCNPERPTTFIVGPANHRRWEIMLLPGEDPREAEKPERVWALLAPWLEPTDGVLWRASSYRFHALLATHWRKGRIFLAGDAAHQQPPFLGQGMCQGIRDVTNLCWKLSEVLRGPGCDGLLDTYETERSQHVYTLTSRIKTIGRHICERDPKAARKRDAALLLQGGGHAATVTRQEIVPPLEAGLIADKEQSASGTLFPQPWILTDGGAVRMDTLTGHGWRLFLDGRCHALEELPGAGELLLNPVVIGGSGLKEKDAIVTKWFEQHACAAAIIRPDHYVYGVARTLAEIRPLLDRLALAATCRNAGAASQTHPMGR
jgi:3-(3-hydroxy-phenyl)propionate hydroxylase